MRDLLGGKGAGLAEMASAGLPVPPGFTITTEACNDYFAAGRDCHAACGTTCSRRYAISSATPARSSAAPANPLLVSVRSGAKVSMPGMMDTVLNLGLDDTTLAGLVALTGDERFALGRVSAFRADVRPHRAWRAGRALRAGARDAKGAARRAARLGARCRRAARARRRVQTARRNRRGAAVPGRPARAARARDRSGVPQLVRSASLRLSEVPQDSRFARHGRQRRRDGVRQHGPDVRHGRCVHARSEHGTARAVRRVPHERARRGRRGRHPHRAEDRRDGAPKCRRPTRSFAASPNASNATTATCRTSSSRSSAAACSCSRRARRSAPPRRR